MNLNKVLIGGRITKDLECRVTPSGTSILDFSIAINSKNKNGDKTTQFIDVKAFGKTADNIEKFFVKGQEIFIEGILNTDEWEKDGVKHRRMNVIAFQFDFVGSRPSSDKPRQSEPKGRAQAMQDYSNTSDMDEIPF